MRNLQFYESGKHLFASSDGAGPLAIAASGGLCGLLSWVLVRVAFYTVTLLRNSNSVKDLSHRFSESNLPEGCLNTSAGRATSQETVSVF